MSAKADVEKERRLTASLREQTKSFVQAPMRYGEVAATASAPNIRWTCRESGWRRQSFARNTTRWMKKPPIESSTCRRRSPLCAGPFECFFTTLTMRMIALSQSFAKRPFKPTDSKANTTSRTSAQRGIVRVCAKRLPVFLTRSSPTTTRPAAWPILRPRVQNPRTNEVLTGTLPDRARTPPMSAMGGKRTLALGLIGIVELFDLDGAFIEIIKQACIDAHLAEVFPKRLPVGPAAADWTMVNANHLIAPDIGCRFA